MGPFCLRKALFSETEKCYCLSMFINHIPVTHLMFSTSYFKSSVSTISIKRVNAMPLWDFCESDFEAALKMIITAESFIVMKTSLVKANYSQGCLVMVFVKKLSSLR